MSFNFNFKYNSYFKVKCMTGVIRPLFFKDFSDLSLWGRQQKAGRLLQWDMETQVMETQITTVILKREMETFRNALEIDMTKFG